MELLIIVVIVVAVWWWLKTRKAKSGTSNASPPAPQAPEIKLTITSSTGTSRASSDDKGPPIDVGPLTAAGADAWVLSPASPLPLTLVCADRALAERVRAVLGRRQYWDEKVPELALLIAQHNLRFKEVDDFVAQHRPKFEALVAQAIASSKEWEGATELDREDLRAEFEEAALDKLGIHIGGADLPTLLEGQPGGYEDDDELLRRFGGDSALYSFYLMQLGRPDAVSTVKAQDWGRKSWEKLAEMGLALRGKDIPVQKLLDGLRLKDLNELLAGAVPKPLGRKAKAIDTALALPDLQERLSQRMGLREMFQPVVPANLNVEALRRSFGYASTVAMAVQQTYYTAVKTLEAIAERKRDPDLYDAWEIQNFEDPLPACAKPYCKKYDRLPAKRPPFHLGCNCQLEGSYKD